MSNTPGTSPLTPDLDKIRHSDEDDTAIDGEAAGLFDDPEFEEADDDIGDDEDDGDKRHEERDDL